MKEEALKLADEQAEIGECYTALIIRRLVEELDKQKSTASFALNELYEFQEATKSDTAEQYVNKAKPLSDEEILEYSDVFSLDKSPFYEFTDKGLVLFTRAILERQSIK